jgi:cold shock protein
VKFFNVDRGFGFLVPADGSGDVFFSIKSVVQNTKLSPGDKVLFEPGVAPRSPPAGSGPVRPVLPGQRSLRDSLLSEGAGLFTCSRAVPR